MSIPRQPDDFSVNEKLLENVAEYMNTSKDQLHVNWEYLEMVQRTKNLRRINLIMTK